MVSTDTEPFNLDDSIESLKEAALSSEPAIAVRRLMDAIFTDPEALAAALPTFEDDDVVLYEDNTVSIWHCRFQPNQAVPPHDHQMSAVIGVYAGTEVNVFFKADSGGRIEQSGRVEMMPGNVTSIGPSAIHAVECTSAEPSCGLHVYLGRLTTVDRTLFDIKTGESMPFTQGAYQRLLERQTA